ncbi:MAG TPA: cupin domain-containing protein [Verrucomicrobiae bacterium]|nr:cupin domain-containing protein [Verrucomicrobiae bacterium]
MNKVNLDQIDWFEQRSPKGRFHVFRKNVSTALGGKRDIGEWGGGHPFDLELYRMPPGATNFPYHSHASQWEMYLVVDGTGQVRTPAGWEPIRAGDTFLCPPGEPHQIQNNGTVDLLFYVIADNPRADVNHYPDSNKWGVKPQRKFFTMQEVDYYHGEDL